MTERKPQPSARDKTKSPEPTPPAERRERRPPAPPAQQPTGERGGPKGPEPTRYGDWEKGGRCFDF